jgi:hypothetical protein
VTALARPSGACTSKLQASPVVRGRPITKKQISENNFRGEKGNLVAGLRWWPDTRTDWSIDRRSHYNLNLKMK